MGQKFVPESDIESKPEREEDRQDGFTRRLIRELTHRADQVPIHPRTIFVGGGTPTLLRPELWGCLLREMRSLGVLDRVEEFTVEANPETVTPELMRVLVDGGVNRVSIGAQSFDPALLKTLERWHDPENVGKAVSVIRDSGIDNINLDLIFAIPGQTLDMLETDLDKGLALSPDHMSCYGLTYEPNTAMTQRLKLMQFETIDEDLERDMYARVIERLSATGFEHYEISNWAKPKKRCRHNLVYWSNGNWIGVGPSAASHINGHRWKNLPHLGKYLSHHPDPPITGYEHLPHDQHIGERLMLGLRLRDGISRAWIDEHLPPDDPRHEVIRELLELGLLERDRTSLRLSDQGVFLADPVITRLL